MDSIARVKQLIGWRDRHGFIAIAHVHFSSSYGDLVSLLYTIKHGKIKFMDLKNGFKGFLMA